MKRNLHPTLLVVLVMSICGCTSQQTQQPWIGPAAWTTADGRINAYLKLNDLIYVRVTHAPKGDFLASDVKVYETKDAMFIGTVERLLNELPSSGTIYKSFPSDMSQWRIELTDEVTMKATLTIYGVKLRSPETKGGSFYSDTKGKEQELVSHIQSIVILKK
jgi:hypothetical protein